MKQKSKQSKQRWEVRAWVFMSVNKGEKYFITNGEPEYISEIYLKKPKARFNPFDYSSMRKATWKPTEIEIKIK